MERNSLGHGCAYCLDLHATQIQLTKQLLLLHISLRLKHSPLMVLPYGVEGMGNRQTESS